MKRYSKEINGELVIKPANEIQILFNGFTLLNPNESDILNDGWHLYSKDQEDIDLELANKKDELIKKILEYDSSENVNIFYKDETPMWLDKTTRVSLNLRFDLELKNGHTTTVLWYDGIPYTMPIEEALQLLVLLEEYAIKCYDTTQMHIYKVNQINTIEELDVYNYKDGYPPILHF